MTKVLFACDYCSQTFGTLDECLRHEKQEHLEKKPAHEIELVIFPDACEFRTTDVSVPVGADLKNAPIHKKWEMAWYVDCEPTDDGDKKARVRLYKEARLFFAESIAQLDNFRETWE